MPIPKPRHLRPDDLVGQAKHKCHKLMQLFEPKTDQERPCVVVLHAVALSETPDGIWVRLLGDDTGKEFKLPHEQVRYPG